MSKNTQNLSQVLGALEATQQRAISRYSMLMVTTVSEHVGQRVRLTEGDRIRAIKWLSWSRRLGVPVMYIVNKAFEWGNAVAGKKAKARRRLNILPLSIASMTSDACAQYVDEQVSEEFGSVRPSTESLRSKILEETITNLPAPARGGLLDYENMEAYTAEYADRIRARRRARELAEIELTKTKPYRGNPFR